MTAIGIKKSSSGSASSSSHSCFPFLSDVTTVLTVSFEATLQTSQHSTSQFNCLKFSRPEF